jgi:hypothetical protein
MYRGYFIHIILELIKWGFRTCYILFLNLVISTPGAYRTKKNDQSNNMSFLSSVLFDCAHKNYNFCSLSEFSDLSL